MTWTAYTTHNREEHVNSHWFMAPVSCPIVPALPGFPLSQILNNGIIRYLFVDLHLLCCPASSPCTRESHTLLPRASFDSRREHPCLRPACTDPRGTSHTKLYTRATLDLDRDACRGTSCQKEAEPHPSGGGPLPCTWRTSDANVVASGDSLHAPSPCSCGACRGHTSNCAR